MAIKNNQSNQVRGFTLLELSIVIVIIGLIVEGISAGQSLVRQAGIRAISSEINEVRVAMNTFQMQYDALPGDMNNAFSYWGGSDCLNATTANTNAGNLNCNGNGDGTINQIIGENVKAWFHLNRAGIIPGSFSGTYTSNGLENASNTLVSDLGNGGYYLHNGYSALSGKTKILMFGGLTTVHAHAAILKPSEAYAIDLKTDDGVPSTGQLGTDNSVSGGTGTCIDSATAYNLDNDNIACRFGVTF